MRTVILPAKRREPEQLMHRLAFFALVLVAGECELWRPQPNFGERIFDQG